MTIDKRMSYEMQGGSKPARNYLGKQKTVSNIPVKWKSGPDAPSTELAYITKAEKDLLLKKNLHGSLKNGPNTGPDNIMSLDSQGDYTRDRSRDKARSQMSRGNQERENRQEAAMKAILTGQKNIGQTTQTGPKTRKYAVPEYVKVKQPGGGYKDKYIGSGYKSYGTPSFFGNLFSRGAPGYRGIKGMPAFWGKPKFETRGVPGQEGFGYYSDYEKFGDTRDPVPLGIMGLIANAINKFKKPKDMSEFNNLQLVDGELVDTRNIESKNIPVPGESVWSDGTFTWGGTTPTTVSDRFKYGVGPVPPSDPFANPIGPRAVNVPDSPEWTSWEVPPGMMSDAYQDNLEFFDNLDKGIVKNNNTYQLGDNILDSLVNSSLVGNQNPDRLKGSVLDAQPKKGIMERISDFFFTPAGAAELSEDELNIQKALGQKTYADTIKEVLPGGKITNTVPDLQNLKRNPELEFGVKDIMELGLDKYNQLGEEQVQSIYDMVNLPNQGPFIGARGGRVGYANGGLASLFTRRG